MSESASITIVMPAFNAAAYLERSLPPLIAMRARGEVSDVIVVDDCSTQASNVETAERLGATVIKMPRNGGPGAARNFACQRITSEIVWFVDADVIAHESGPVIIRKAMSDDTVVAVFGSYDDKPPGANFASQYKNLIHRYYHQRGKSEASTFWAGCGAVRRSSCLSVGGFNRKLYRRPSIEDIDLGHRLLDSGGRILLLHDLLGTHLKYWTIAEVLRTDIFQRAIPWSRLMLNSKRKIDDLNVASGEKLRAVLAGLWLVSLLTLPLAFVFPPVAVAFALMSIVVAVANRALISFFVRARGIWFALQAVLYHQIYYCYSATVYALCWAERFVVGKTYKAGENAPVETLEGSASLASDTTSGGAADRADR